MADCILSDLTHDQMNSDLQKILTPLLIPVWLMIEHEKLLIL